MSKIWKIQSLMFVLVAAALVAGCEAQKPQAGKSGLNALSTADAFKKSLGQLDLQALWQRDLPMDSNDSIVNFYCLGDTLILVSEDNNVYAVNAKNGNPKWGVRLTETVETVFAPSRINISLTPQAVGRGLTDVDVSKDLKTYDAILINSSTRLMLIDNATGAVLRDVPLKFIATGSAASTGQQAIVMSSFKSLCQIDLMAGVCGFTDAIDQESSVPMVCSEGMYYMASQQGLVNSYAIKNDIAENWKFDVQGAVTTPFVVNDMGVFVASGDGRIYGLSLEKGQRLWLPVRVGGVFSGPMTAGENLIFQFSRSVGLAAVSADAGKLAWIQPDGVGVLANFDGKVYTLTKSYQLAVVREVDGEVQGTASLKPFTKFAQNTTQRSIFAATTEGRLICITPDDVADLTVEDVAGGN